MKLIIFFRTERVLKQTARLYTRYVTLLRTS